MTAQSSRLALAVDEVLEEEFREFPRRATRLGVDGYDSTLDDMSEAACRRRAARAQHWVRRFQAFDDEQLTAEEAIDRAMLVARWQERAIQAEWEAWRRTPEPYLDTGIVEMFLLRQRSEDELTASAASRLRCVEQLLAQGRANLDASVADRVVVERSLRGCRASVDFCRTQLPELAGDQGNRRLLAEAGEEAAQAYADFADFLEDLAARCEGSFAYGEHRYSATLRQAQLLDVDAATLRERGEREYARLDEEMSEVAATVTGGERDWRTLLRTLQQQHAGSIDAMRDEYEVATLRARDFAVEHDLITNPPDEHCQVIPAPPAVRATISVASYIAPPMFRPSREGLFYVPYPVRADDADAVEGLLQDNAHFNLPSTAVHETYPGHHWHLVNLKEARPVRRVFQTPYFNEGWALYAERMMADAGYFSDEERLGQLLARLFRAARIVVDVSLHCGDMTFDDAVRFMCDRALMHPATARAEVARYCSWPTQASAYLTGAMVIEDGLRVWTGSGRGLREFHDSLTTSGSLPVPLALRAIGAVAPSAGA